MAIFPGAIATDIDLYLVSNNLGTVLTAGIDAVVGTIPVVSTTGFPATGWITIDQEAITYTGITGTSFTGATRGAGGTVAAAHLIGVGVKQTVVAAHHNSLKDEVKAIEQYLSDHIGLLTTVTAAEFERLVGVTSPIQTQLNAKATDTLVVHLAGAESITGIKTFDDATLRIKETTGSEVVTLSVPALSANRIVRIPDAGLTSDIVLTEGAQTLNGNKTLSALIATLAANLAAGGFKLTGLGAGSVDGDSLRYEQRSIKQIVSSSTSTFTSATSTSYTDSGLSATITPTSASSKILVIIVQAMGRAGEGTTQVELNQSTSGQLMTITGVYLNNLGSGELVMTTCPIVFLDSPNTTSARTYKTRFRNITGGNTMSMNSDGTTATNNFIYLIELAGV